MLNSPHLNLNGIRRKENIFLYGKTQEVKIIKKRVSQQRQHYKLLCNRKTKFPIFEIQT